MFSSFARRSSVLASTVLIVTVGCGGGAGAPSVTAPSAASSEPRTEAKGGGPSATDPSLPRAFLETRGFTLGFPRNVQVTRDGKTALFLRSGPRSPKQTLFEMNLATGAVKEVLTPETLAAGGETLSAEEKAARERMRVTATGFTSFQLDASGDTVTVSVSGRLYRFDRKTGRAAPLVTPPGATLDPQLSPDGKSLAYVRDWNLHVWPMGGGRELALTTGGSEAKPFGLAEFIAQEELYRFHGFWWSPDGAEILYQATDQSGVDLLSFSDPTRPEAAPLRSYYPRPGRRNAEVRLGIVPAKGGPTTWIRWDQTTYPYVATVSWFPGAPPTLYVMDRAQRRGLLLAVDRATGATRTLVEEHDDLWLEIAVTGQAWRKDGSAFVWMTERSGRWALELHSTKDGSTKVLTPKDLDVRRLVGIDDERRVVYVAAGYDPTEQEIYAVPLDGSGDGSKIELVARAEGGGSVMGALSADKTVLVASESPRRGEPRVVVVGLRDKTRAVVPSVAEKPPLDVHVELAAVGDKQLRVAIVRPTSFDPKKKYPLIDLAYGGAQTNMVTAPERGYLRHQWMADATGAIVVSIDARGTPRRGSAWQRAMGRRLAEVPIDDHVDALRAIGAKYPEADFSRVGITGWSHGGYLSLFALFSRPDVFKAAVAGAPVVDWRDYDSACSERYLGPLAESAEPYDRQSPLRFLKDAVRDPARLGKLLLVHGTADDNVFLLHSLKLVDAMNRVGYPYALLPLVGETHLVRDPANQAAFDARLVAFFREHLAP